MKGSLSDINRIKEKQPDYGGSFLTNRYAVAVTLLLLIAMVIFIILDARAYSARMKDLYANGVRVTGRVTRILDNISTGEGGTFHSWDVFYFFLNKNQTWTAGIINEPEERKINIGDAIYVIYSKDRPLFHAASVDKPPQINTSWLFAVLRPDNFWKFFVATMVGVVSFAQLCYLYKTRQGSEE